MEKTKVFGIGLQKSGCSTFISITGDIMENQFPDRGFICGINPRMDNLEDALECIESKFMIGDYPTYRFYKEYFEKYGDNSKFVLTRRKHIWQYARSIENLYNGFWNKTIDNLVSLKKEDDAKKVSLKTRIENYLKHNQEAREFFEGKDNFIEICWEEEVNGERYCEFLGIETPEFLKNKIPVVNATKYRDKRTVEFEKAIKEKISKMGIDPEAHK